MLFKHSNIVPQHLSRDALLFNNSIIANQIIFTQIRLLLFYPPDAQIQRCLSTYLPTRTSALSISRQERSALPNLKKKEKLFLLLLVAHSKKKNEGKNTI